MRNIFHYEFITVVESSVEVLLVAPETRFSFAMPVCKFRYLLSRALRTSSAYTSLVVNGARIPCRTSDLSRLEVIFNRLTK